MRLANFFMCQQSGVGDVEPASPGAKHWLYLQRRLRPGIGKRGRGAQGKTIHFHVAKTSFTAVGEGPTESPGRVIDRSPLGLWDISLDRISIMNMMRWVHTVTTMHLHLVRLKTLRLHVSSDACISMRPAGPNTSSKSGTSAEVRESKHVKNLMQCSRSKSCPWRRRPRK